tara:strand:+ start:388 stop:540 length:153 start_codon:yes stop_codon:yes gene_type:complete
MSEEEDKEVKEQDFQQKMLQFIQTSNFQLQNMQQKISQTVLFVFALAALL